jgi:hypothetical protein
LDEVQPELKQGCISKEKEERLSFFPFPFPLFPFPLPAIAPSVTALARNDIAMMYLAQP